MRFEQDGGNRQQRIGQGRLVLFVEGEAAKGERGGVVAPGAGEAGEGVVERGETVRPGAADLQGMADAEAKELLRRPRLVPERPAGRQGGQPVRRTGAEFDGQAEWRRGRGAAGERLQSGRQRRIGKAAAQHGDHECSSRAICRASCRNRERSSLPVALRGRLAR